MCFNETAVKINYGGGSIEDFKKGFSLIRANGQTSLGAPLVKAIAEKFVPDICIYVTDQGENHSPLLETVYKAAKADMRFIFINVPHGSNGVAEMLERSGADVSEFSFDADVDSKGWYASLDNFSALLTKGGYSDLVQQIMDLDLPKRVKVLSY
jgi:hypothetical protein